MTDILVDKSKSSPFPKHTVLVIILCRLYNRLVLCMICRASLFYFSFISSTKITLVSNNYSHCSSGRTKNKQTELYDCMSGKQWVWFKDFITKQFFPFHICWSQMILTGLVWTELNCTDDSDNNYSTCDISHFYVLNTHTNTHWNEVSNCTSTLLGNLERLHPLTLRLSRLAKTMISCHSRSSSHAKRGANAPLDTDKSETVMSSNVLFQLAMRASQKLKA